MLGNYMGYCMNPYKEELIWKEKKRLRQRTGSCLWHSGLHADGTTQAMFFIRYGDERTGYVQRLKEIAYDWNVKWGCREVAVEAA